MKEKNTAGEQNSSNDFKQRGNNDILSKRGLPLALYNNDGDDLVRKSLGEEKVPRPRKIGRNEPYNDEIVWEPTQPINSFKDYLNIRIGPLADSEVDGISYCTIGKTPWELPLEHILALGNDPLVPIIDWWKQSGKQFFFSMRMNDIHHGWIPGFWNKFRIANPQFLLVPPSNEDWNTKYLPWINGKAERPADIITRERVADHAFDYSYKEVRDHYLDILKEACRRYDVDGIEFDFIRANRFFPAGKVKGELMTEFVMNARMILDKAALRVCHPIKLVHRVPDSIEKALETGLFVEEWMKNSCVDAIISGIGEVFCASKTNEWVELAHRYGVAVYGNIERFDWGKHRPHWGRREALRAAAATLWYKGVDGMYFFNHFIKEEYPQFRELLDKEYLATLPKQYFLDWDYINDKWVMLPKNQYGSAGPLPIECNDGIEKSAKLIIADKPQNIKEASLELTFAVYKDFKALQITLNGNELHHMNIEEADDKAILRIPISEPAQMLKYGENEFKFTSKSDTSLIALYVNVIPNMEKKVCLCK